MDGKGLREKLHGGGRIYGTMISVARNPRWANVYARLDLDYVIVDTEHSPASRGEAAALADAFAGAGVCPIIRVPNTMPHETIEGLDAGFHGVLVPYCEGPDEVRAVVAAARLRPLKGAQHDEVRDGTRQLNDATKAYLERRNANNVVMIGIESEVAINNLEQILDVGGFDVIFIGPNDLSITLGVPDDYGNPKFQEAVEYIISTCAKRGIAAGGHWFTEELVQHWMGRGSRFILYHTDASALIEGYRASLDRIRGSVTEEEAQTI